MSAIVITSCNKKYFNFLERLYLSLRISNPNTSMHCRFVVNNEEEKKYLSLKCKDFKVFTYDFFEFYKADILVPKHPNSKKINEMFFRKTGSIANCLKHLMVLEFLDSYEHVLQVDTDNIIIKDIDSFLRNKVFDILCVYQNIDKNTLKNFVKVKNNIYTETIFKEFFTNNIDSTFNLIKEGCYFVRSNFALKNELKKMKTAFMPYVIEGSVGGGTPALMLIEGYKNTNVVNDNKLVSYKLEYDCLSVSGFLDNKYKIKI